MANGSNEGPLSTGGAFGVFADVVKPGKDDLLGREVGDYRIRALIAEGGMGRVYRAERTDGSFERDVAVKLSLAGRISSDLRQRFVREQQILASMSHPSVASLYDAGTTDDGWPYIIMELLDGEDIATYVESRDMSLQETIKLLLPLLDALAFAHSRLVVHRDIKPSNVIVDEHGTARLLDFGIAKLIEDSPAAATSARPLTLTSASPEQLLGEPITVASDIYQVGLLLHRLLLRENAVPQRTLSEAVSAAMDARPFRLSNDARRQLGPDLAAILSRCLQPEPADRYRDMNTLRDDLANYLDNKPVSVTAPTLSYRFGKLVRRNRGLSAVIGLLIAVVVGGTAMYTVRINEARLAAEREAATAEEVIAFLTDIFEVSDPDNSRGEEMTARELLDSGAERVEAEFSDRPVIRARLQHVIAGVYREMGLPQEALPLAELAYALRSEHLGPLDRRTMIAGNDLAILYDQMRQVDDAIALFLDVLERQRSTIGSNDEETLKTLNNLGAAYITAGDFEAAARYLEEALDRRLEVLGPDHPEVGSSRGNLAIAYMQLGNMARARELFTENLEFSRRVTGRDSPDTIIALANVGAVTQNSGMYDEAVPYFDEAWRLGRRVLGEGHFVTLISGLNRAEALINHPDKPPSESEIRLAEELVTEIRSTASDVLGPEHGLTTNAIAMLAVLRNRQGRHEEALELIESVLAMELPQYGKDHVNVIQTRVVLAETYLGLERNSAALNEYVDIDAALEAEFGPDYPDRLNILRGQARVHIALGELDRAESLYRESARRFSAAHGENDPMTRQARSALDNFLLEFRPANAAGE